MNRRQKRVFEKEQMQDSTRRLEAKRNINLDELMNQIKSYNEGRMCRDIKLINDRKL